jgi:hypothetical protein
MIDHRFSFLRWRLNRTNFIIFSLLAITGLVILFHVLDFFKGLGGDYTFYFSNGWFLNRGLRTYVDFWTHKPPFLGMVLAVWISMFGTSFYSAVTFLIFPTLLCSYAVFGLASVMMLRRSICLLSGILFALFASLHTMDPDRNGIIIIFASLFELLSITLLILGLRRGSKTLLTISGILIVIAVASRQTSLPIYFGLLAIIAIFNGRQAIKRTVIECLVVSFGCAIGCAFFIFYLFINGADLRLLWDQLAYFNILYAQNFRNGSSLPAWLYFWANAGTESILLFFTAGLAYLVINIRREIKERSISINTWILMIILLLHFTSLWLSGQEMSYYAEQIFPEMAIISSIVIVEAIFSREIFQTTAQESTLKGKGFVITCIVIMLILPLGRELVYSYGQITDARAGNYLSDISNLPSYVEDKKVAQTIQAISKNTADKIWLLQYGHDMVYVMSNRLPAIPFTQSAPVNNDGYSDERIFSEWLVQFMKNKPKVVVLFPEVDVTRTELLRRVDAVVEANMDRVSLGNDAPAIFVWRGGNTNP